MYIKALIPPPLATLARPAEKARDITYDGCLHRQKSTFLAKLYTEQLFMLNQKLRLLTDPSTTLPLCQRAGLNCLAAQITFLIFDIELRIQLFLN